MASCFLLIDGSGDNHWKNVLKDALAPLGKLYDVNADYAITKLLDEQYGVVIVDATTIEEVEPLVSRLRAKQPDCRIVVMTASPTWQRARAAFEAGAIDYIPKTLSQSELHDTFKQILQKPLPPWPR